MDDVDERRRRAERKMLTFIVQCSQAAVVSWSLSGQL